MKLMYLWNTHLGVAGFKPILNKFLAEVSLSGERLGIEGGQEEGRRVLYGQEVVRVVEQLEADRWLSLPFGPAD